MCLGFRNVFQAQEPFLTGSYCKTLETIDLLIFFATGGSSAPGYIFLLCPTAATSSYKRVCLCLCQTLCAEKHFLPSGI